MFMVMELSGAVGILLRFMGVLCGILAVFALIKNTDKKVFDVKKWIVLALILESCYFLLLLPAGFLLAGFSGFEPINTLLKNTILGIDYLLMIVCTAPFLGILAVKLYKFRGGSEVFKEWKWVGAAFVGYIVALWANSVLKWFDMTLAEGFSFFTSGIRAIGALNAFVLMSLALGFSVYVAFLLIKGNIRSAFKWAGLVLVLVGLHFLIFVIYSYLVGIESFLMLAEIWTIPLLGLGLTMLWTRSKPEKTV